MLLLDLLTELFIIMQIMDYDKIEVIVDFENLEDWVILRVKRLEFFVKIL